MAKFDVSMASSAFDSTVESQEKDQDSSEDFVLPLPTTSKGQIRKSARVAKRVTASLERPNTANKRSSKRGRATLTAPAACKKGKGKIVEMDHVCILQKNPSFHV